MREPESDAGSSLGTFLVRNWGVVTSLIGPSAQGCEGATEDIMNGALVSKYPKTTKGRERMNLVFKLSIVVVGRGLAFVV